MFDGRRLKKTRHKIMVQIRLDDMPDQTFYMFVAPEVRVQDVLNDERDFLPFERMDGSFTIVRKTTIRSVDPIEALTARPKRDPYEELGVEPEASDAEIQEAYRRAISAVHPDRMQSLGLTVEFVELANRRAALINEAFSRIRRERSSQHGGA